MRWFLLNRYIVISSMQGFHKKIVNITFIKEESMKKEVKVTIKCEKKRREKQKLYDSNIILVPPV